MRENEEVLISTALWKALG